MGKVDDMRAWNEWREYHRALKRDKAVDKLSPVERMRRLEKLEKHHVSCTDETQAQRAARFQQP